MAKKYKCDCAFYFQTGWYCSHSLAAMHLLHDVNLTTLLTTVAVRRGRGRPAKVTSGLQRDFVPSKAFAVAATLTKLRRCPTWCMLFTVAREFEFVDDVDRSVTRTVIYGRVAYVMDISKDDKVVYMWCVQYTDGDEELLDIQEIAELIESSAVLGVDITACNLAAEVLRCHKEMMTEATTAAL